MISDDNGNIGLVSVGTFPVRADRRRGRQISRGWTDENEWIGYVPSEGKLHDFNPPCGYVFTANNRLTTANT